MPDRLLDTNAVSALMTSDREMGAYLSSEPDGAGSAFFTSVVAVGEVAFGLARLQGGRKKNELTRALREVLERVDSVLSIELETGRKYAALKAELWRRGRPMGENDLWIAASALEHRLVLVTSDVPFRDVPGLQVENWREPRRS